MAQVSELVSRYADVSSMPVRWLWYPYIALGKITLLQGDPGDGKSTMMLNLIAALSSGTNLPDGTPLSRQYRVIYQCSEDDAADTIKPRLLDARTTYYNDVRKSWEVEKLSLDKAVKYGKEKRKPYRGSKLIDYTCRNHGGCPYCEQNRKHKFRDKHPVEKDEMIIWIADGRKDPSFLLLKNIYSTKNR